MPLDRSSKSRSLRHPSRQQGSYDPGSTNIQNSSPFSASSYRRLPATHDTYPYAPTTPVDIQSSDLAVESGAWTGPDGSPSRNATEDLLSQLDPSEPVSRTPLGSSNFHLRPNSDNRQTNFPDFYPSSAMQYDQGLPAAGHLQLPADGTLGMTGRAQKRRRTSIHSRTDYRSDYDQSNTSFNLSSAASAQSEIFRSSPSTFRRRPRPQVRVPNPQSGQPSATSNIWGSMSQSSHPTVQTDHLPSPASPMSDILLCSQCSKTFDKRNEFNKHVQSHEKRFHCNIPTCSRGEDLGFTTQNDLDRHLKTVHGIYKRGEKIFWCPARNCTALNKYWPRWDNFKQHVCRMHQEEWSGGVDKAIEMAKESFILFDPDQHAQLLQAHRPADVETSISPSVVGNPVIELNSQPLEKHHIFEQNLTRLKPAVDPGLLVPTSQQYPRRHGPAPKRKNPVTTTFSASGERTQAFLRSAHNSETMLSTPNHFRSSNSAVNPFQPEIDPLWDSRMTIAAPEELYDRSHAWKAEDIGVRRTNQALTPLENEITLTGAHMNTEFEGSGDINLEASDQIDQLVFLANRSEEVVQSMRNALALYDSSENPAERERNIITALNELTQISAHRHRPSEPSGNTKSEPPKRFKCSMRIMESGREIDCPKSFDKHNELKKHEKRHERLYGCTDDNCIKRFGSKWEWKRHECRQHEQRVCWRCDIRVGVQGSLCAHVCNNDVDFRNHLQSEHQVQQEASQTAIAKRCKIHFKWQGSYWCGFCEQMISNIDREFGNERYKHRFDHIYDHLHSKTERKQIEDWINLGDGGKTKRMVQWASRTRSTAGDTFEGIDDGGNSSARHGDMFDDELELTDQDHEQQSRTIDQDTTDVMNNSRSLDAFRGWVPQAVFGQGIGSERQPDEMTYKATERSYSEMMGEDADLFGDESIAYE